MCVCLYTYSHIYFGCRESERMKGGSDYKKRLWTEEEDRILMDFVRIHGKGKWNRVAKMTGLQRCGKSCRLRWINYLSPSVKRGDFSEEEEDLIIRLHNLLGNRWSLIAGRVPGRTDNQVKNHWNTRLSKKLGFKNGKHGSGIASSKSGRGELSPSMRPSSSSEEPSSHNSTGDTNLIAAHGGSPEATRSDLGTGAVTMDGSACDHMSSFFPSVYEDMNLYAPNAMEFTDYCDLDIIWHGL